jgi:hypothetical protein
MRGRTVRSIGVVNACWIASARACSSCCGCLEKIRGPQNPERGVLGLRGREEGRAHNVVDVGGTKFDQSVVLRPPPETVFWVFQIKLLEEETTNDD